MLKGKHIILGITGGIAAYKCATLTRLLVKAGAEVQVIMTPNAKQFIQPLTLSTLSGKPVIRSMEQPRGPGIMGRCHDHRSRHGINHRQNG